MIFLSSVFGVFVILFMEAVTHYRRKAYSLELQLRMQERVTQQLETNLATEKEITAELRRLIRNYTGLE